MNRTKVIHTQPGFYNPVPDPTKQGFNRLKTAIARANEGTVLLGGGKEERNEREKGGEEERERVVCLTPSSFPPLSPLLLFSNPPLF